MVAGWFEVGLALEGLMFILVQLVSGELELTIFLEEWGVELWAVMIFVFWFVVEVLEVMIFGEKCWVGLYSKRVQ